MIELNLLPDELRKKELPKFVLPEIPIQKTVTIFLGIFFGIQAIVSLVALIRATHIHFEPLGFPQRAVHGRLAKWRFQCTTCTK